MSAATIVEVARTFGKPPLANFASAEQTQGAATSGAMQRVTAPAVSLRPVKRPVQEDIPGATKNKTLATNAEDKIAQKGVLKDEKAMLAPGPSGPEESSRRLTDNKINHETANEAEFQQKDAGSGAAHAELSKQTQDPLPVNSPTQAEGAAKPTESNTMVQSISGATQAAVGEKAKNDATASALIGRISAAPKSPVQAEVLTQAQLINSDCLRSEAQITQIAATRRQHISAHFFGARKGLSDFLTSSIVGVQTFIYNRQAMVMSATIRALTTVTSVATSTLFKALVLAVRIRAHINQLLANITASVQKRVSGIVNQIMGVINSVPLPDIPGIAQIRGAAVGLLNQAAGVVNGAFGLFLGVLRSVLNTGMTVLASLLSGMTRTLLMALSLVTSVIWKVLRRMTQALTRAITLVSVTLRRILFSVIMPTLTGIESLLIKIIGNAEQSALSLLRTNRRHYLDSLVDAVSPGDGSNKAQGSKTTSIQDTIVLIKKIGHEAIRNNRFIVQTFEFLIGGIVASIIRIMLSAAVRLMAGIAAAVFQVMRFIMSAVNSVIQTLSQVVQAIANFLQALIQALTEAVEKIVESMRSLFQGGAEQLIQYALNGVQKIGNFIRRFVQNMILGLGVSGSLTDAFGEFSLTRSVKPVPGSGGPITIPRPGPITIPGLLYGVFVVLAVIGAIIVYYVPQLGVIVAALVSLGLSPLAAYALLALLVITALLLLLLLLLLVWWLTKTRPPKPPPCKIVTRTIISAPDRTADTRKIVGVNEQVNMDASTPATWSASHGTVSPVTGPTTIWTAPDPGASCTIKAAPVSGSPCSVTLKAIPPSERKLISPTPTAYTAGLAGSGFVATVEIVPKNVSFSRIEVMEGSVSAVAAGYYDTVLHWHGIVHPPTARWLPVNIANSGIVDTVGSVPPGTGGPFGMGFFYWPIPQRYRVAGGPGGKQFSTGRHVQAMIGASGEEVTTKEGATRKRRP
jgi:hypothetical protein